VSVNLKTGEEQWRILGAFHHSINQDYDGYYWVCASRWITKDSDGNKSWFDACKHFEDQLLVKVSKSGVIAESISMTDLIMQNNLEYLLFGSSVYNNNSDPLHLNEICPILEDSGKFRKGQLLVSLRNISTVFLVDPKTHKIIWHQSGPWLKQHSVFHVGKSTLSLLDNHAFGYGKQWLDKTWMTRIAEFNAETGEFKEVDFNRKTPSEIKIPVEGRAIPIDYDTWALEDCHNGTVMIFRNQSLVYKWSNKYANGNIGITSWCRYIDVKEFPDEIYKDSWGLKNNINIIKQN
jgi:hypothetical protein